MQARLYVEDRDTAYLVLDAGSCPPGDPGHPVELRVDPSTTLADALEQEVWQQEDTPAGTVLTAMESEDANAALDAPDSATRYPIPAPTLCLDYADYRRHE